MRVELGPTDGRTRYPAAGQHWPGHDPTQPGELVFGAELHGEFRLTTEARGAHSKVQLLLSTNPKRFVDFAPNEAPLAGAADEAQDVADDTHGQAIATDERHALWEDDIQSRAPPSSHALRVPARRALRNPKVGDCAARLLHHGAMQWRGPTLANDLAMGARCWR